MSRGPTTFRQRDAAALIKAALAAGLKVERIEVGKDGKIIVVTKGTVEAVEVTATDKSEWDNAV